MPDSPELTELASQTHTVYEQHGAAFDQQRPKGLHEQKWLDRFIELLPENASILDAGCGAGEPFIPYFLSLGLAVTGLDFSESMLRIASARFPELVFHHADMVTMQLEETFDGIIAWNSFFHLTQESQRQAMAQFSDHLNPGGVLMLTVGPEAGEVLGHVNGAEVYHASLSPDDYVQTFADLGVEVIEFVKEDQDCDLQTVLIGRKSA